MADGAEEMQWTPHEYVPARLQNMPTDILLLIFKQCPDFNTLQLLIEAYPLFLPLLKNNIKTVYKTILSRNIIHYDLVHVAAGSPAMLDDPVEWKKKRENKKQIYTWLEFVRPPQPAPEHRTLWRDTSENTGGLYIEDPRLLNHKMDYPDVWHTPNSDCDYVSNKSSEVSAVESYLHDDWSDVPPESEDDNSEGDAEARIGDVDIDMPDVEKEREGSEGGSDDDPNDPRYRPPPTPADAAETNYLRVCTDHYPKGSLTSAEITRRLISVEEANRDMASTKIARLKHNERAAISEGPHHPIPKISHKYLFDMTNIHWYPYALWDMYITYVHLRSDENVLYAPYLLDKNLPKSLSRPRPQTRARGRESTSNDQRKYHEDVKKSYIDGIADSSQPSPFSNFAKAFFLFTAYRRYLSTDVQPIASNDGAVHSLLNTIFLDPVHAQRPAYKSPIFATLFNGLANEYLLSLSLDDLGLIFSLLQIFHAAFMVSLENHFTLHSKSHAEKADIARTLPYESLTSTEDIYHNFSHMWYSPTSANEDANDFDSFYSGGDAIFLKYTMGVTKLYADVTHENLNMAWEAKGGTDELKKWWAKEGIKPGKVFFLKGENGGRKWVQRGEKIFDEDCDEGLVKLP